MGRQITGMKKFAYQLRKINKYGIGYLFSKVCKKIGIQCLKSPKDYMHEYYKDIDYNNIEDELVFWYESTVWEKLDLNNPITFNEKLQWLKIYDSPEIKTTLADKYAVRAWVESKIGKEYLIDLLGVWSSFDEINFDELPDSFVLKCNHGSGMNVIIKNKSQINRNELKNRFDKWMQTDFAACDFEPHYHSIERKIIAEKYISNGGDDLYDYKFWCNNGKCDFIMFLSDRKKGLRMANFDKDWNLLPFVYDHERIEEPIEKPDNLSEMIRLAEKLAVGFTHVRVDFYRLNDGSIKFGEMTFTSMSGVQTWIPNEYNKVVGDMMLLPEKEKE